MPPARDRSDDVRFFFYFDQEELAAKAASALEEKGYGVTLRAPVPEIPQWAVLAEGVPDTIDISTAEDLFEPWAAGLGGEYDGNEIKLS